MAVVVCLGAVGLLVFVQSVPDALGIGSNVLCSKPIRLKNLGVVACGRCLPCRINRRSEWASRLELEALSCNYEGMAVTLTYTDETLPAEGVLVPKDLTAFIKRLRYYCDAKFRFYGVGEYGDQTGRPHYHVLIFGASLDPVDIRSSWRAGYAHIDRLTAQSLNYCTKDVVKSIGIDRDGRQAPFQRMSNRPAIGFWFLPVLVDHCRHLGVGTTELDVPTSITMGGKRYPLGRTLRNHLRRFLGVSKDTQLVGSEVRHQLTLATKSIDEVRADTEHRRSRDAFLAAFYTDISTQKRSL